MLNYYPIIDQIICCFLTPAGSENYARHKSCISISMVTQQIDRENARNISKVSS